MIYENILKIKDIIGYNFITFENGLVPVLTFINPEKYEDNLEEFDAIVSEFNNSRKYEIECIDSSQFGDHFKYTITPRYYQLEDKIEFVSKEWSIEEMIEILVKLNQ
jgi:hypothetical protein